MSFPDMRRIEVVVVTPGLEHGRAVARAESGEWTGAEKTAAPAPLRSASVRMKVDADYLDTFITAIDAAGTTGLELTLPGYDLFSMASEANLVQVTGHSQPQRDRGGVEYSLDISFLWLEALEPA